MHRLPHFFFYTLNTLIPQDQGRCRYLKKIKNKEIKTKPAPSKQTGLFFSYFLHFFIFFRSSSEVLFCLCLDPPSSCPHRAGLQDWCYSVYLLTGTRVLAYWYRSACLLVQKYLLTGTKVLAYWYKSTCLERQPPRPVELSRACPQPQDCPCSCVSICTFVPVKQAESVFALLYQ